MAKLIIYGFLFYLLYRFITNLVVPVGKATQQMKQQMQQMQEMQNRQEAYQRQQAAEQVTQKSTPTNAQGGDYIEFEEVKP